MTWKGLEQHLARGKPSGRVRSYHHSPSYAALQPKPGLLTSAGNPGPTCPSSPTAALELTAFSPFSSPHSI